MFLSGKLCDDKPVLHSIIFNFIPRHSDLFLQATTMAMSCTGWNNLSSFFSGVGPEFEWGDTCWLLYTITLAISCEKIAIDVGRCFNPLWTLSASLILDLSALNSHYNQAIIDQEQCVHRVRIIFLVMLTCRIKTWPRASWWWLILLTLVDIFKPKLSCVLRC